MLYLKYIENKYMKIVKLSHSRITISVFLKSTLCYYDAHFKNLFFIRVWPFLSNKKSALYDLKFTKAGRAFKKT